MTDKDQFAEWQREWRMTGEDSPPRHRLPQMRKRGKTTGERVYLLAISALLVGGLLLMATGPQPLDGKHALLILAVTFSLSALWLGSSRSGPDPVSEKPERYIRLRERSKARELGRTRIGQLVAVVGVIISFVAIWFALKGQAPSTGLQKQFLPIAVLVIAMSTTSALVIVRAKRSQELKYLRELQHQFDRMYSNRLSSEVIGTTVAARQLRSLLARIARQISPSFPNNGASGHNSKRKKGHRRIYP